MAFWGTPDAAKFAKISGKTPSASAPGTPLHHRRTRGGGRGKPTCQRRPARLQGGANANLMNAVAVRAARSELPALVESPLARKP